MQLLSTFFNSSAFSYFVLPFLIFLARIIDVTIGTVRIVMVAKGQKMWAPILGFFEIMVWLLFKILITGCAIWVMVRGLQLETLLD